MRSKNLTLKLKFAEYKVMFWICIGYNNKFKLYIF